jgi:hypothetical protein
MSRFTLVFGSLLLGLILSAGCRLDAPDAQEKNEANEEASATSPQTSTDKDTDSPPTAVTPPSENGPVDPADIQAEEPGKPAAPTPPETNQPGTKEQILSLKTDVLSDEQLNEGWIRLFDGVTLFGWEASSAANWRVEEGAIVVDGGESGLLCTTVDFSDYILRVEFKAEKSTNSGIFLRTPLRPTDPKSDCYELNIAPDDNPYPTGSLVGRLKKEGHNREDWQAYEVTVEGNRVQIALNGETIGEYIDESPVKRGRIGLQLNEGLVAFRNVYLKPLSRQPIFDGKTLDGWQEYPEMPSKFTVTDGLLHVENGRGQLETTDSYGDFLLQLECRTNAPHLNGGIFFRCVPGEQMNGYESQIQNQWTADRTDPADCGTGGIFRRVNARLVVSDDQEWFYNTIVATGPNIAVWVNGLQVTAWSDDRKPDANPRRGLRTEPGTIMIQGHDPTTNVDFRNFQVVKLP